MRAGHRPLAPVVGAEQRAQEVRVGDLSLSEIDDDRQMALSEREVHTLSHPTNPFRLRAADENGRARSGAMLPNLDHPKQIPPPSQVETRWGKRGRRR